MEQSIFRSYDIRGVYPSELDEKLAYAVGFHFRAILDDVRMRGGVQGQPRGARLRGARGCPHAGASAAATFAIAISAIAFGAINWTITRWLKRQLRNVGAAFCAS